MNRESANRLLLVIRRYYSDQAAGAPVAYPPAVMELTALIQGSPFPQQAAMRLVEKIVRGSPKTLRNSLYDSLIPTGEQKAMLRLKKVRNRNKSPRPSVTNVATPWQGGAPGSGKRK